MSLMGSIPASLVEFSMRRGDMEVCLKTSYATRGIRISWCLSSLFWDIQVNTCFPLLTYQLAVLIQPKGMACFLDSFFGL